MPLAAEDVHAIQNLLADYNFAIDDGDAEAFASMFVDDGVLETVGINTVTGTNELQEFAGMVAVMAPGPRHQVSNIAIDVDGDTATTRLYLQMFTTAGGAGETKLVISGRYQDTLRKDDGTWRFVRRVMTPDS